MKNLFLIAFVLFLASCSVSNKSETCTYNGRAIDCADMPGRNNKPEDENSRYQFFCNKETCDSRTQYCLRLDDFAGRTQTMGCRPKANNCDSCDCLKKQSQRNYPATCSSEPTCDVFRNSIVSVVCRAQ